MPQIPDKIKAAISLFQYQLFNMSGKRCFQNTETLSLVFFCFVLFFTNFKS